MLALIGKEGACQDAAGGRAVIAVANGDLEIPGFVLFGEADRASIAPIHQRLGEQRADRGFRRLWIPEAAKRLFLESPPQGYVAIPEGNETARGVDDQLCDGFLARHLVAERVGLADMGFVFAEDVDVRLVADGRLIVAPREGVAIGHCLFSRLESAARIAVGCAAACDGRHAREAPGSRRRRRY
jgi:hypothetical protein